MNPRALRQFYREGNGFRAHTYGACAGHLQTNLVMMQSDVAEKFERFCLINSAPCPLIHCSPTGDFTAPVLGKDIDIRLAFASAFVVI